MGQDDFLLTINNTKSQNLFSTFDECLNYYSFNGSSISICLVSVNSFEVN